MKKNYSNLGSVLFFLTAFSFLSSKSFGQLSGTYTINPTKAVSSSNYRNWASAIGDMLSGSRSDGGSAQGPGVSSAVTFEVYDTLYDNTSIELTAITGASNTNTILFKSAGGDSSKCRLRSPSSTSSTNDYVLLMNGVDFVTFQEIGFERTGTNLYSTVVQITNDADKNNFIRCFLKGRKVPSNTTNGFQYGIGSIIYFTGNGDSINFIQNKLVYGYNGVYNASSCTANTYSGNSIDTSGSSGIYTTQQNSLKLLDNTFNMGDFGAGKGHYVSYAMRIETSPSMVMAGNKIFMYATNASVCRAIVIAAITSPSTAPALVYNNLLMNSAGTTSCTGFAIYGSNYVSFLNNNVLITNTFADGAAFHLYPPTNGACSFIKIINNNLINKGGGYAITVPGNNGTSNLDSVNFNNLYTTGKYIGLWDTNKVTNLTNWRSITSRDANSLNLDPGYQSNTDLHVSNIAINGKAIPYSAITFDIDKDSRDQTNPDIGADEFFPVATDAGISNLDSPIIFCAGKQNVKATFQNFGYDTLKSLDIHWQINSSTQSTYNWTGSVAPGESSAAINLGSFTFSSNTGYTFKVWTKNPNNTNDGKNENDTLKILRYPAMAGNYSIGDTSIADYHSFNEAISAMTARGLCGATNFNVFKGVYTEQLGFGTLPGMGASNPITFKNLSNDSTSVVISLPSTTATGTNNSVVQLRGASYVTFKNITFERTGANPFAQVIHVINGAHHNTFSNCQMIGLFLSTANTNAVNIWSDQGQDNYNTFKNNYIKNGNFGMLFSGIAAAKEIGNVIEGNIFEGAFNNSVQLLYNDSVTVKGNIFSNVIMHGIGNYDLQLQDCDNSINISGNYFKSNNTDSSIFLVGCNGTASKNGFLANNFILKNYGKAIVIEGVDYLNIVFNTIRFNSNLPSNIGIFTSATASTYIKLFNNIIYLEAGEVFHINTTSQVSASDYNNLLTKGSQFAYWGTSISNFSGLNSISGMDAKSLSIDPLFLSGSDLHIKNYLLKSKGVPFTGVTTDIDNETRNTSNPDIGADEFKLVPNDAGIIAVIKPLTGTCAGVLDVSVVIKNFGNDTLKSAIINWSVNGALQAPYNWSGKLKTNATDTAIIGSFNFTAAFNPKFIIKSILPNGLSDGIQFNDSIIVTRSLRALPAANAGPDINICSGDSIIIGPTSSSGLSYKWTTMSNSLIASTSEITVKPKTKTAYILEVTNTAFGCVNRDTIEIGVNTKPIADAGSDKTICPGNITQIGATSQTGFNYDWTSIPSGFTSKSANPTDGPSFTTKYILQKTVTGTGCSDFDTVIINVASKPIPKIAGIDNICKESTTTYSSNNNSGNSYLWIVSNGQITSGQTTNSINILWKTEGVGIIKLIETNSANCFDTATYYVVINPNPLANFSLKGTCLGSITNFTNLSLDAQSYSWTFGDGTSSILKDPSHTYAEAISYNITLIVKNSFGCPDTITQLLPIEPLPVANFTYLQKPSNTIDFTSTSTVSSGSINSWNWNFGDGNNSTIENPSHQFSSNANSSVTLCVKSVQGCESCTTKLVGFTDVRKASFDNDLKIQPNPGLGVYSITSSKKVNSISVLNSLGQVIKTNYPLNKQIDLNITDEPNGIYYLKINMETGIQNYKLIKQ
jgi:PKD repeat protein